MYDAGLSFGVNDYETVLHPNQMTHRLTILNVLSRLFQLAQANSAEHWNIDGENRPAKVGTPPVEQYTIAGFLSHAGAISGPRDLFSSQGLFQDPTKPPYKISPVCSGLPDTRMRTPRVGQYSTITI